MRRIQGRSVSGASAGVIFTVGSGCALRSGRTGRVISAGMSPGDVTRIRTNEQGASLRSDPYKTDYNKIRGVHAYYELDVYDEQNGWYYVYYNGQYGDVNPGTKYVTVIAWGSR